MSQWVLLEGTFRTGIGQLWVWSQDIPCSFTHQDVTILIVSEPTSSGSQHVLRTSRDIQPCELNY
ncbi:hypothetical protein LEMLEM_LOCUS4136 [Lemmus lemmus]